MENFKLTESEEEDLKYWIGEDLKYWIGEDAIRDEKEISEEEEFPKFGSFEEVLQFYANIIGGVVDGDLSPGGRLEEETIPLLPYLNKMNKASILTISSQPGLIVQEDPMSSGQLWFFKQRAYVDCFMTFSTLAKILSRINMEGIACYITSSKDRDVDINYKESIPLTKEEYSYPIEEESSNECIITSATLEMTIPDLDIMLLPEAKERVLAGVVHVLFIDLDWGRPLYLFETIANSL